MGWGRGGMLGEWNSMYKGPEVEISLTSWQNREQIVQREHGEHRHTR